MPPTVKKQTNVMSDPSQSILERVGPIGFDPNDGIKLLLYGRSGTGKTTLWGTFPKPILALICSGGDKPGELRTLDTPANRKVIDRFVVNDVDDLAQVVAYLNGGMFEREYKTVVLDHCTGFQDMTLGGIIGRKVPAQKSWGLASQQQYGQLSLQCKEAFRELLGLTCNIVMIAQERNFNEGGESDLISPTIGAGLTPSLAGWLNTAVDYICNTFIREEIEEKAVKAGGRTTTMRRSTGKIEYCLRAGPHQTYITKFRMPKGRELPSVVVDPSYDKLISLIRGPQK